MSSSFGLRIELRSPVVLTRQSGTQARHQALDYIPGAVLLGLAAERLYAALDGDTARTLFHSGCIRFSDAVIADTSGSPCLPAPLSWVGPKGYPVRGLSDGLVRDLAAAAIDRSNPFGDGRQAVQMRGRHVGGDGTFVTVPLGRLNKSALDPDGFGRTADGALFAHQHIAAGTVFVADIRADAAHGDLARRCVEALVAGDGIAHVGRSRHAQYGEIRITSSDRVPAAAGRARPGDRRVVLALLSDTVLRDPRTLMPTLTPTASAFDLPERFLYEAAASAVRLRAWSPFNGHRRSPDLGRQALHRGSVLVFATDGAGLTAEEAARVNRFAVTGVGLGLEEGLGQIAVSPPWAGGEPNPAGAFRAAAPRVPAVRNAPQAALAVVPPPASVLCQLAARRRDADARDRKAQALAGRWLDQLAEQYRGAQAEAGGVAVGPTRSQWGHVRTRASSSDGLRAFLNGRSVRSGQWAKVRYVTAEGGLRPVSFRDLIEGWLETKEPAEVVMAALERVAAQVQSGTLAPEEEQR